MIIPINLTYTLLDFPTPTLVTLYSPSYLYLLLVTIIIPVTITLITYGPLYY